MADLILHHYPGSPFAEKVRLVLGCKQLAWRSVTVPVVLPKPDVVALTGGYRRTPFLQIGADVYCDSALICRVLERVAPAPSLYPVDGGGMAEIVAQWADSALFWAAIPYTMQPAGIPHIFVGVPSEQVKAFSADRAAMTANMRRATIADCGTHLRAYLQRVESMLQGGRRHLLGDVVTIADFSVAHPIWFMRRAAPIAALLDDFPRVARWHDRVLAFGHGASSEMTSAAALEHAVAADTQAPVAVAPGEPYAAGATVVVTPTDYAHDEVLGTLVGLDANEVVLSRRDERAGSVHVHFPRIGYQVKAPKPAPATP